MDLDPRVEILTRLMEERLGLGGEGFAAKLARAGRRLPRRIRRDGALIVDALSLQAHPKLSRQLDAARLDRSLTHVERHLRGIDPWDRRKGIVLNWLAGIAFSLLVVAALFVAALRWRGLI
ncbi:hypothetical protein [Aliiroseovarius sp.]|uniref:hypothetical protein n=1 Tax=Aliiroseovarius sp. TaxID=1872442 RepID=UPI002607AD31|nr:hypothetical protein [Aliiroseovarius sp.]